MDTKERILVSACLLGVPCRYDGKSVPCEGVIRLKERAQLVPVCPEQLGGLATPRTPAERRGESVVTRDGKDVTAQYRRGAQEALRLAPGDARIQENLRLIRARAGEPAEA